MESRPSTRVLTIVGLMIAGLLVLAAAPMVADWLAGPTPPPDDTADAPIGAPPAVEDADSYAFIATRADGTPVRYDPCTPLHVVINPDGQIDDGERMIEESLTSVADATGLKIVIDGETDARPGDMPEAQGENRPPPTLVAWSDVDGDEDLEGDVAGFGGSVESRDGDWWDSGEIVLDAPDLQDIVDTDGFDVARAIVMHEMGHVVGLDHVDDPGELMQPVGEEGVTDWGPGDRAGLAKLGTGGCRTY